MENFNKSYSSMIDGRCQIWLWKLSKSSIELPWTNLTLHIPAYKVQNHTDFNRFQIPLKEDVSCFLIFWSTHMHKNKERENSWFDCLAVYDRMSFFPFPTFAHIIDQNIKKLETFSLRVISCEWKQCVARSFKTRSTTNESLQMDKRAFMFFFLQSFRLRTVTK